MRRRESCASGKRSLSMALGQMDLGHELGPVRLTGFIDVRLLSGGSSNPSIVMPTTDRSGRRTATANLKWLWLHGNSLSGAVPATLMNLASLESLLLYGQAGCLTATDPALIAFLQSFDPLWNDGCP